MLYLAEVEQGGGTSFPGLGMEVQPKKGSAVFFANTDHHGVSDRKSLHAGDRRRELIATKWLREREY